jgi:hypothetical protein
VTADLTSAGVGSRPSRFADRIGGCGGGELRRVAAGFADRPAARLRLILMREAKYLGSGFVISEKISPSTNPPIFAMF